MCCIQHYILFYFVLFLSYLILLYFWFRVNLSLLQIKTVGQLNFSSPSHIYVLAYVCPITSLLTYFWCYFRLSMVVAIFINKWLHGPVCVPLLHRYARIHTHTHTNTHIHFCAHSQAYTHTFSPYLKKPFFYFIFFVTFFLFFLLVVRSPTLSVPSVCSPPLIFFYLLSS